ncbi:MAG: hypothetical protein ACI9J3_003785 [Parvicellaceae bacterium]|jgi:hypothetical protein
MPDAHLITESVPQNFMVIQMISIAAVSLFLLFISRLIIKGKLREEYSILWFVLGIVLLVFSIWRDGLDIIADALGVDYAPSLLFMFGILVIIMFLVHLSVVSSKQHKQIKELSQELGLLNKKRKDKEPS